MHEDQMKYGTRQSSRFEETPRERDRPEEEVDALGNLSASQVQDRDTQAMDQDAQAASAANHTILLVDDDPDIRTLARTFLEHIGFRVLSSADPDRAAQIFLSSSRVDLLITDQNMPGRSGMDLARQLTTLRPDLPVLMISGAALEPGLSQQFTQPGWSFLPKPFSLPALLNAVHTIMACMLPTGADPSPAI